MIVVIGHLTVDAADRDRVIALSAEAVRLARSTDGCLDFAVSADAVDPARVNVAERWRDRTALDAFRGPGTTENELGELIRSADVLDLEVPDA